MYPPMTHAANGASVRIEVDDAEIATALRRLVETGADLRPAMTKIADTLFFSTQRRFETKSGPDGQPWTPFARSTLRRMPARRSVPQLLRDSGRLYASLTTAVDAHSAEIGPNITYRTDVFGTNIVYANIHQFGGTIAMPAREGSATFRLLVEGAARRAGSRLRFAKSGERRRFQVPAYTIRIPARPYLGLSDADKADILSILANHLVQNGGVEGRP